MDTFLWVLQWLLASMFLMAGMMKLMQPKEKLVQSMGWANDFTSSTVKFIGVAEVLAAIGLVVPPLTDIAPIFSPLAATGLVLLMIGAFAAHRRRDEVQFMAVTAMLAVVAAFVAIGRFFIEPF